MAASPSTAPPCLRCHRTRILVPKSKPHQLACPLPPAPHALTGAGLGAQPFYSLQLTGLWEGFEGTNKGGQQIRVLSFLSPQKLPALPTKHRALWVRASQGTGRADQIVCTWFCLASRKSRVHTGLSNYTPARGFLLGFPSPSVASTEQNLAAHPHCPTPQMSSSPCLGCDIPGPPEPLFGPPQPSRPQHPTLGGSSLTCWAPSPSTGFPPTAEVRSRTTMRRFDSRKDCPNKPL